MSPTAEPTSVTIHGTTIAWRGHAILLQGRSGSGKSDLALRCLFGAAGRPRTNAVREPEHHCYKLVSDDQTRLERATNGEIFCTAPEPIAGKLEVRGVGIIDLANLNVGDLIEQRRTRLVMVAALTTSPTERLPETDARCALLGRDIRQIHVNAFEASAPEKLHIALLDLLAAQT